jgi:nonribosomal peptide synthetase protein VioF
VSSTAFRSWDLFGDTAVDGPLRGATPPWSCETTVTAVILDRCRADPDRLAVDDGVARLTYGKLAERAAAVAAWLSDRGAQPGTRVAVVADRTAAVYPCLLGALLARCAYVPVDPGAPPARIRQLLDRADARFVITSAATWAAIGTPGLPALLVDEALPFQVGAVRAGRLPRYADLPGTERVPAAGEPGDAAYVIFTSGSSGTPKGVVVEHRSVVNLAHWVRTTTGIDPGARVTQSAALFFDASVQQIFAAWFAGAAVLPVPERVRLDGAAMLDWLGARAVTHWDSVPSLWTPVVAAAVRGGGTPDRLLPDLRAILLAGEELPAAPVNRWEPWRHGHRLFNIYGPTEVTVDATWHEVDGPVPTATVPIGRPLPGIDCYVLDGHGRLCPPGVGGELYLGGLGLARGYLDGTAAGTAFVGHDPGTGPVRLYRTGDLVEAVDGELVFVGRRDHQMKINGVRIDPGEVEHALRADARVSDAAAVPVPHADGAGYDLAAVVAARSGVTPEELRVHLASLLPTALLPARLLVVDALPRTANGKVDRRACADLMAQAPVPSAASGVPASPLENRLLRIWRTVLRSDEVGLDDDFFASGGDSIATIRLRHACADEGITIASSDVFVHPTPRRLAASIGRSPGTAARAAGPAATVPIAVSAAHPPLLPSQRAILAAALLAADDGRGHRLGLVLERRSYAGPLDEGALRIALDALAQRHDALRLSIDMAGGPVPRQVFADSASIRLAVHDAPGRAPADADPFVRALRDERLREGFDLASAPLLRVDAVRRSTDRFDLLWTMHHCITDGLSWEIVHGEFEWLYLSARDRVFRPLRPPRLGFRELAARLTAQPDPGVPARLGERLAALSPLRLPRAVATGVDPTAAGVDPTGAGRPYLEWQVSAAEHDAVRRAAAGAGTTTGSAYLYALARALGRLCRTRAFALGVVSSGRDVPVEGIEDVVGCLARQVPVPVEVDPAQPVGAAVRDIGRGLADAVALDAVDVDRALGELGVHPLVRAPEVSFSYQNYRPAVEAPAADLADPEALDWVETGATPLALVVYARADGGTACRLEYWADTVDGEFARSVATEVARALRRVVERR